MELYDKVRADAIAKQEKLGRVMTEEEKEWHEACFCFNELNTPPKSKKD